MDVNKLVRMANQIAANLDYGPDKSRVVDETVDHLRRFWSPPMKKLIIERARVGDSQLSEIAALAVDRLGAEPQHVA